MKKRILSVILALCLCVTAQSVAYAGQGEFLQQEDVSAEEAVSELEARDAEIPTPTEVYEAMIALKDQEKYKEGTPWTDDEPYSDSKGYYRWKGGTLGGANIVAVGCVAFAFILSDAAFGALPARMYAPENFKFEDIKPGDILRMNTDTHTVIVLEVSDAGVVVAEGNIAIGDHKGKIHWGRTISKEEVLKDISHYITRYPEGYIAPDDPEANVSIGAGTLEGGLTWNLTKAGTMTISGDGAMPDFSGIADQPWGDDNCSKIRKVIFEDGVTSIGSCAFWKCGVLSVKIPSSVTMIGNSAFRESSIVSVTIPSNVKTIGDSAFRGCQNLSSVVISEGVETIRQNAFNAASLVSVTLPPSIGEVGDAAFNQCQKLESATFIPGDKKVILGDNMFTGCYYLMNVTLPKSADRIGAGMFQNCMYLTGVEIPQDVESIGTQAFASCSALSTVIMPKSITSIETAAFSACPLKEIYFTGTEAEWNNVINRTPNNVKEVLSKAEVHYNFTPTDISGAEVILEPISYIYDGEPKTPTVTVMLDSKELILNMHYTVFYSDNINVGTAKVTVTGKADYAGSKTVEFGIVSNESSNPGDGSGGTGDGNGGGTQNPGGSDESGGGTGNPGGSGGNGGGTGNPGGSGGSGNPGGSDGTDGADSSINLSKANITLDKNSYTYDGTAKTPAVTVTLDGKTLVLNTDYTVSYSNNIKVGTAAVTVTGKGKYTGSKTINFTITEAAGQNPTVSITCKKTVYKVAYGVKPFKINAVSEGRMTFTSSKPKIAAVDKNTGEVTIKNTGVAVITVQAGNVSKQVTVKVSPKKQSVKSAKPGKGRKLTVKWAKDKKASGYQVQVSTDKKFKKNLKAKKTSKTSYTFTKLKTGKKYYVRVRSYKKSGKETLYGSWSKVKSTGKIKK